MYKLTKKEESVLRKLNTPKKIQDFLDKIPINFDYKKDTCMSPRVVLGKRKCHCIEGAIFAAACLKLQGKPALIIHLKANNHDYDHVIAVFKEAGHWGAISKTNHTVLRYRDPIYKSIKELVMSYFHEYTDKKGRKNLRSYSKPLNLSRFDKKNWLTSEKDLWHIDSYLNKVKHFKLFNKKQLRKLRNADKIVIKMDRITEYSPGKKSRNKFKIRKL